MVQPGRCCSKASIDLLRRSSSIKGDDCRCLQSLRDADEDAAWIPLQRVLDQADQDLDGHGERSRIVVVARRYQGLYLKEDLVCAASQGVTPARGGWKGGSWELLGEIGARDRGR